MKVGTDGCLLGGWFDCSRSRNILDIGCGSGLISLMAAQRCDARITGVEIDREASFQAIENVKNSLWPNRIEIKNCDLLSYESDTLYDTIVSNPPYFQNSLKCDNTSRTLARHSDSLGSMDFFARCAMLATTDAKVSVIIPCDIMNEWERSAAENGFHVSRATYIKTTPSKTPKRVLIEFARDNNVSAVIETLVLEEKRGEYSEQAKKILRDFYLKIE